MTTDWPAVLTAIQTTVKALSPKHLTVFRDEKQPFTPPDYRTGRGSAGQATRIELNPARISVDGLDGPCLIFNNVTQKYDVFQVGLRKMIVEIVVKSYVHTRDTHARTVAERIRTGLRFPSSSEVLSAAGVTVDSVADIVTLERVVDDRAIAVVIFEATFGFKLAEQDATALDWFRYAEVTSRFRDSDGNEYPNPLQITQKIIGD